jgi:hypothetical protein
MNPLREWLFDADEVDGAASSTSPRCVWLPDPAAGAAGRAETYLTSTVAQPDTGESEAEQLLAKYRDHIDVLKAEATVEREARLEAERKIVEGQRNEAERKLANVTRAFRSLAAALLEDDAPDRT